MPAGANPKTSRAREACDSVERNELPSMSSHSVDSDRTMVIEDETPEPAPNAEVVVKGRNVEVPEHFRIYVSEKLSRLERFDRTIYLFDVELDHERNRRQRKNCQHVEITARGRGPVVRGEACADSFYAALESAVCKLESRLRRSKDRRKVHYGDKTPVSLAQATAARPAARDVRGAGRRRTADRRRGGSTITSRGGLCAPRSIRPSR